MEIIGSILAILLVAAFVGKRISKARAAWRHTRAQYWAERNS
jgi:hypothetical protein